jgi:hypothetical protein
METGKYISKTCDFAGNILPVGMYDRQSPSQLLKSIMAAEKATGSLDFSAEMTEKILAHMPEHVVGMKANGRGALEFSEYKRADFLSPTNPTGATITGAGLVPILVSDTVMEGAMPYCSARNVLEVWRTTAGAQQVPFFTARKAAKAVAPNADAVDLAEGIGKALAIPEEYKLMCTMDKGLLQDASVDIKAAAIKEMGAALEIALNQKAVDVCLANAYGTNTSANTADALKGLNLARGQIGKNGFRATGALIAPMFEAYALNAMAVPAYNDRAQGVGENANLLRFAGLDLGVDGSNGIDWGTSGDIGAIVVDKSHAPHIILRQDMSLDIFDNLTKYAEQPVAVSRFDVVAPIEGKKQDNKGAVVKVANA